MAFIEKITQPREEFLRIPTRAPAVLAALLAVSMLLVGAGPAKAAPLNIRFGWVVAPAEIVPYMFKKPGLAKNMGKAYTLTTMHFNGTSPMITALASNQLDIGLLAYSSFALAVENAHMTGLRVIGDGFQDGVPGWATNRYMVRKDSKIKTVADLKGKVLATNVVGSAVDMAVRMMLVKHHINPATDVSIIEAPFPTMASMLAERKVDFVATPLPFSKFPALLKIARPLFTQKQAMGQSQMIVWAAQESFVRKNRAALVAFAEDALRARRYFINPANHKEAVKIAAGFVKQPVSRYEGWLFTHQDYYRDPNGLPNVKALQNNVDAQHKLGFLKHHLDVAKYVDLSIFKAAADKLGRVASAD